MSLSAKSAYFSFWVKFPYDMNILLFETVGVAFLTQHNFVPISLVRFQLVAFPYRWNDLLSSLCQFLKKRFLRLTHRKDSPQVIKKFFSSYSFHATCLSIFNSCRSLHSFLLCIFNLAAHL